MTTLYQQALDDLNATIELAPRDVSALVKRGFIWETVGDLEKALVDYSRVIELNPTNSEARINRGNVYLKRADYSDAAIDETVAIQLGDQHCDPVAYFYRAQAYRGLQRWNAALADYRTYVDADVQGFYAQAAQACIIAIASLLKPVQEPSPAAPTDKLQPSGAGGPVSLTEPQPIDTPPAETQISAPTVIDSPQSTDMLQPTDTDTLVPMAIHRPQPADVPRPVVTNTPKLTAQIGDFLKIPSVDRVISHLRMPLFANGYALVLSSGAMSGLGLLYWAIAARLYGNVSVGLNSAAISAMTFLGAVAQLNLAGVLTRFIPVTGRSTARWVAGSYLISAAVAAVISTIFLMGLRIFSPELDSFLTGPSLVLWFGLATICWTVINIQDGVLTGLRQAIWVPVKNTGFGLAKILLLIVFASSMPISGVFVSWTIGVVLVILPASLLIFLRLLPKRAHSGEPSAVGLPRVVRYAIGDYFGALCVLGSTTLLPLLVIRVAGAAQNAYFYMASTIGFTLYLISPSMGWSLTVEAVHDQARLSAYSWKVFLQTLRIVVPLAGIFIIGAPLMLRIFGDTYAIEGSFLLRLLALSAIPNVVNTLYLSVARAQGRAGVVFVVSALLSGSVLVLSYIFLARYGIDGIGLAWTIGQGICAVILFITQFRPFWKAGVHTTEETRMGGSHSRSGTAPAATAENNG